MSRTIDDIKMSYQMPLPGWHRVTVIDLIKGVSAKKKTPQIDVILTNGESEFNDTLFVTDKTLTRLVIFAKRICEMPGDTPLPDSDAQAAVVVAKYIMENGKGKSGEAEVVEVSEDIMIQEGPDTGRIKTFKKRKISFSGYRKIQSKTFIPLKHPDLTPSVTTETDDLPF
jgi:hypothetical protein